MKGMIKLMAILAVGFASTFLLLNATGIIDLSNIKEWLSSAQSVSPVVIGSVIAALLFADLFIAMPTLTLMLLSGFLLGPVGGAVYSIAGLTLAGFTGYGISRRYGESLIVFLIKDNEERNNAIESFQKYGVVTILLSRAVPILPEVSACMAGLTRMPVTRFVTAWLTSTVPYAVIASYAGSISTLSNPTPAILTATGLTVVFWGAWLVFRKKVRSNESQSISHADRIGNQSHCS